MKKEIHFYPNYCYDVEIYSFEGTVKAIERGDEEIRTNSMINISFDLIDKGYDIYLHTNKEIYKIEPGMHLKSGKELRKHHNLLKIFLAGCFD